MKTNNISLKQDTNSTSLRPRKKIVRIGTTQVGNRYASIYCSITFDEKNNLSISGVIGPLHGGNCLGSCGQIVDDIDNIKNYAVGWSRSKVLLFKKYWKEWHLNNMRAGHKKQMDLVKGLSYEDAVKVLKQHDMYEYIDENNKYYKYGHGWHREDVPNKVLDFLFNELPYTDKKPAWV